MIISEFLKHKWEKARLIKHWKECMYIVFFQYFLIRVLQIVISNYNLLRYVFDLVARAFGCQYSVRCRPAESGEKRHTMYSYARTSHVTKWNKEIVLQ